MANQPMTRFLIPLVVALVVGGPAWSADDNSHLKREAIGYANFQFQSASLFCAFHKRDFDSILGWYHPLLWNAFSSGKMLDKNGRRSTIHFLEIGADSIRETVLKHGTGEAACRNAPALHKALLKTQADWRD
jgi:hypothetical protein